MKMQEYLFIEVAQQMQTIDYSHHKLLKKAGLRVWFKVGSFQGKVCK